MTVTHIHQFVHSYVDYDATSTHARHLRSLIQEMGYESEVYAGEWRGQMSKAMSFREYSLRNSPNNTRVIYQFATASPICDLLLARQEQLAVNYHNVTPYSYLAPWEPGIAPELEVARKQLSQLAPKAALGIGVSGYNEKELRTVGYARTAIAPVLFDPQDFAKDVDQRVDTQLKTMKGRGGTDILFVGRIAPHKCQHHLIAALAMYRQHYDPNARLHLVGGISSHHYWTVLKRYIAELRLEAAVNLTGSVSGAALGAYYANADIFACLSEHEGFGVPLIEAMYHDVPVVAFDAAAIGETLGGGGILLKDKSPAMVAGAWHAMLGEETKCALVAAGRQRLGGFSRSTTSQRWRAIIEQFVEGDA